MMDYGYFSGEPADKPIERTYARLAGNNATGNRETADRRIGHEHHINAGTEESLEN